MTDSPEFHGAAPWIACSNLTATVEHYRNVLGFTGKWHWFWGEPPDHEGVSRACRRPRIDFTSATRRRVFLRTRISR